MQSVQVVVVVVALVVVFILFFLCLMGFGQFVRIRSVESNRELKMMGFDLILIDLNDLNTLIFIEWIIHKLT